MELQSVRDIDFAGFAGRTYFPSPPAWEDQVLYFLMLDRFSDGREDNYLDNNGTLISTGSTPLFATGDAENVSRVQWEAGGHGWKGGTLKGLEGKIGYLKRLGVTAIWISPVLKQVAFQDSYHGYGTQNFLDVDRHFGTAQDLKELVQTAHEHGIRVILDVILNHTGDVFSYNPDRYEHRRPDGTTYMDPRWDGRPHRVSGFNDATGAPIFPFGQVNANAWPDGAVWPEELQAGGVFTQKGTITNWDYDPEFREGDFMSLKDVSHGSGETDHYKPSEALKVITDCYKYWIAFADLDGFRVDTVKHMDPGATRFFTSAIHEFAMSLGKEQFYLIGEITGGRERAFKTLEITGMDAALGIDDIPDKLEYLVKGYRNPAEYFNLFRNSLLVQKDSHIWFRDKVVTMFDDHDQVRKGKNKARFCANDRGWLVVLNALAMNLTTVGIPCIYYGTEQCFNGKGLVERDGNDMFLRECMFGGTFGSLQSVGRHFFNESAFVFQEIAKITRIRKQELPLRRGRQYLREISGNGVDFGPPVMMGDTIRSIVPWSRLFNDVEVLVAINTDYNNPSASWVTLDNDLHRAGDLLTCLYSTNPAEIGNQVSVEARNGKAVRLSVPAAGFVIYK
ncbi:glycosidase [Roseimicrobium gellanilyticum]|uniref:Glycosidase n=1 Tax=Roseimicrobium gellanilyticum TaxID=748857 RepID=A0A366HN15_9BACT|nr:alpha-amylase family glycosyl hydrolase [Roseimicrobium gellanilyticum]RBP43836.1 glycosidase [Roseimicrobium gellanilyticum]